MRVISGTAGRIRLDAPKSMARPSTDRLREALFSILRERVVGVRVLDLFAGSGALGIEALSRGALHATFVDHDRAAVAAVRANLKRAGLAAQAEICPHDVFRWLKWSEGRYDLVFADPPYVKEPGARDLAAMLLSETQLHTLVREGGMMIVETGRKEPPEHGAPWRWMETRTYGRSHLHFFTLTG